MDGPFPRRGVFLLFLGFWLIVLVIHFHGALHRLETVSRPGLPPGAVSLQDGEVYVQDFSYQMLFFRGIRDHATTRPYTLAGQESLMRHEWPQARSGMTHAYSPVALVLALPLIAGPRTDSYLFYLLITASGIWLLFWYCLFPRAKTNGQLSALLVCAFSLCLALSVEVGQSSLLTVTLLGFLWHFLQTRASLARDLLLAVLFWMLCLKPSVAIVPLFLLLGARCWRALGTGVALLLLTWIFTCPLYGGWWTGLRDYSYLLSHYYNGAMGSFMSRGAETASSIDADARAFSIQRDLLLGVSFLFLFLRWSRRITPSEYFQGLVWSFLLFSPYLLPSEDWILCLLVVEGNFFGAQPKALLLGKLLLLAGILDLRDGLTQPWSLNFPLKCLLAAWILCEGWQASKASTRDKIAPSSAAA